MERAINSRFYDYNMPVVVVAKGNNTCVGCCYAATIYSKGVKLCFAKRGYVGACAAKDREDKTDVIFQYV